MLFPSQIPSPRRNEFYNFNGDGSASNGSTNAPTSNGDGVGSNESAKAPSCQGDGSGSNGPRSHGFSISPPEAMSSPLPRFEARRMTLSKYKIFTGIYYFITTL